MARYLVTGGAGFIGSNIVKYITEHSSDSVRVLDNLSSGKRENLVTIKNKCEFCEGDIRNLDFVRSCMKDIDYVLHLAAIPSVPRSVEIPLETNDANITGTLNVLVAARDENVKRVVFSSSSSIYGDSPVMPKVETMMPNPISPYAVHKLTGEYYCNVFYHLYGLKTIILRYFNVFGPSQNPHSDYAAVIPKFITMVLNDQNPTIFGDGEQSRDFTYVDNIVHANLIACSEGFTDDVFGQPYNVACNDQITLNELVIKINDIIGKNIEPHYLPPRAGDIKHSLAGIDRAKKILKYAPEISMEEGLELTIGWYKKNGR
ncbi:SDR family oxidoreductase [bacterium]|nr:SDR family oxidoreductase [bacterium]